MDQLKARDTISGQEGRAYATINGRREDLLMIRNISATAEKEKNEVKTLGRRGTQHKANGWTGTGEMNIFYMSPLFRRMMLDYMRTGVDTYFDMMIVNDDPTSTVGVQTTILKNVNLDSVVMTRLDTDADALDEDVSFTFDGVEYLDEFVAPAIN